MVEYLSKIEEIFDIAMTAKSAKKNQMYKTQFCVYSIWMYNFGNKTFHND